MHTRLWSLLVVSKQEEWWGDISGRVEGERMKSFETPNLKREAEELSENQSFCEFLISMPWQKGITLHSLHVILKELCQLIQAYTLEIISLAMFYLCNQIIAMYQELSSLCTYLTMFVSQLPSILKTYINWILMVSVYRSVLWKSLIICCSRFCASVSIVTRNNWYNLAWTVPTL